MLYISCYTYHVMYIYIYIYIYIYVYIYIKCYVSAELHFWFNVWVPLAALSVIILGKYPFFN